jgi:hypothetical protein
MKRRSNLLIASGLLLFPVMWLLLVVGQTAYFGPMRSSFEKIGRRYLDNLPFGWGLFDLLFYALPILALMLVALGFATDLNRKRLYLYLGIIAGLVLILLVRRWSPGYL